MASAELNWARPWQRRCKAHLDRDAGRGYWGRCDLRRGHIGPHALERGMEIVVWPPPAEVAARLAREFALAREIVARRTRMPAYLASDEDWAAALEEAQAVPPPPDPPQGGLADAIRRARGNNPTAREMADQIDFLNEAAAAIRRATPPAAPVETEERR